MNAVDATNSVAVPGEGVLGQDCVDLTNGLRLSVQGAHG
jgi:hypothetical protein